MLFTLYTALEAEKIVESVFQIEPIFARRFHYDCKSPTDKVFSENYFYQHQG